MQQAKQQLLCSLAALSWLPCAASPTQPHTAGAQPSKVHVLAQPLPARVAALSTRQEGMSQQHAGSMAAEAWPPGLPASPPRACLAWCLASDCHMHGVGRRGVKWIEGSIAFGIYGAFRE